MTLMDRTNPLLVAEAQSLQPFLPMIYMAWIGGELSPEEFTHFRNTLQGLGELDDDSKLLVSLWLDPEVPPSVAQLKILHSSLCSRIEALDDPDKVSLAKVGEALAREQGEVSELVLKTLDSVQEALGAHGPEPVQDLLTASEVSPPPPDLSLDQERAGIESLQEYLEEPYGESYQRIKDILAHPRFFHRYGETKEIFRERVANWCHDLAREGMSGVPWPQKYGGEANVGAFLAMSEVLAAFDSSLLIKFGVHIGLFAGSIYNLGTERHHEEYLPAAISFDLPGCFAMTETGHGSNVRDIQTTATFDKERQEFIIHTPSPAARKDYIGNAALHAQLATVFAQLIVDGENYGVHAFLVPIRDKRTCILPGISIEDDGDKIGLQGVDNGRITFHSIRVPRENLLDRFGQVSPEGEYTSPINNPGKRFFMMLSTLVMGRVSLAAAATAVSKVGLAITIRYADGRRQFGPSGQPEVQILDYQTYQRRLLPHLATAYALTFANKKLVKLLVEENDENRRELEGLAAGLKVFASWHTIETLQVCRESCGGQGYLSENRLGTLKADTDIFATFEGSNPVLLQLVAKGLLTEYRHQFAGNKFFGVVKFLSNKAAMVLAEQNPLTTRNTDPEHLRDPEFQLGAFRYREDSLLVSAAQRLKSRLDQKMDPFVAFNECQEHLVTLAQAHIERVILESFQQGVQDAPTAETKEHLDRLCSLYALNRIQKDAGWFLEAGLLEPSKSKAIRSQVIKLCAEVRPHARNLVDAFGFPDKILSAPIALGEVPA